MLLVCIRYQMWYWFADQVRVRVPAHPWIWYRVSENTWTNNLIGTGGTSKTDKNVKK